MTRDEIAAGVMKHAREHYEERFGWSEIVECFTEAEVAEEFVAASEWYPEAATLAEALERAQLYVDVREERYREAVGPDMKCEACGQTWQYETGHWCPRER